MSQNTITKEQIFSIAEKLPYGAGREVAKRAGVSEAFVSLFLNGKLTNNQSRACLKVIKECISYIKTDEQQKEEVASLLESI